MEQPAVGLVVGLGNPGERYADTRHNVGFRTADRLLERAGGRWEASRHADGWAASAGLAGRKVWLVKPATYMNESGRAVQSFAAYYKVPPEAVLVISDDIDLPLGSIRIRVKGSSGGQRGLDSVLRCLGTQAVPRVRLGVGPKPPGFDAADFVLSRFKDSEGEAVEAMVARAAEAIEAAAAEGVEAAMNRYNVSHA